MKLLDNIIRYLDKINLNRKEREVNKIILHFSKAYPNAVFNRLAKTEPGYYVFTLDPETYEDEMYWVATENAIVNFLDKRDINVHFTKNCPINPFKIDEILYTIREGRLVKNK